MVTGGTMANFVAFLAARKAKLPWDARAHGMGGEGARRLRVYASTETHTWIHKAVDLFGLGLDSIAWISTHSNQQINTTELCEAISADRAQGVLPFMVIGTAGTVSTGAVDPLPELAAIAREHGSLWFHDGWSAYGGFAALAKPNAPADLLGIERSRIRWPLIRTNGSMRRWRRGVRWCATAVLCAMPSRRIVLRITNCCKTKKRRSITLSTARKTPADFAR